MKANELRIGNWILKSVLNEYTDATPFQITKGYQIDNAEHYFPIELTPEILEKIEGIVADNYGVYVYQINDEIGTSVFIKPYTTNSITKYSIGIAYELDNIINLPDLNGLHSLQNLIFSLTQTELNINL